MKAKTVYGIATGLIVVSWLINYGYFRYYTLPEAGFLRHYIETTEVPSVAFNLVYVANRDDKRKPVNVQAAELPALRFYPVQVHQEMRRQTLYILRGYYDLNAMEERKTALEPIRLHTLKVFFSDGSVSEEDVGEITVYREPWPVAAEKEAPVQMSFVGGSSNYSGEAATQVVRPVTYTGVSSSLLEKLGEAFQFEVRSVGKQGSASSEQVHPPLELKQGEALKLSYQFRIPANVMDAMSVYNVQLRENFEEPDGSPYNYIVFANYVPSPTEADLRAYVREMRRRRE
jgi:hypothetical protein